MQYSVQILGPDRLRQAFSLVQAVHPRISLDTWRCYARPHSRAAGSSGVARRGIFLLEDQKGCILALFAFRVEPDLRHGRILQFDYVASVDLLNPRQALRALIDAFCRQARLTGCRAVRVATPRSLDALESELANSGFAADRVDYGLAMEPVRQAMAARR